MSFISIVLIATYFGAILTGNRILWHAMRVFAGLTAVLALVAFVKAALMFQFGAAAYALFVAAINLLVGAQAHAVLGGTDYISRVRRWIARRRR